jgi:hypothetical protein
MSSNRLACAVRGVLSQGLALLSDCTMQSYTGRAGVPFNASIGQHYRHVLDHFLCLINGKTRGLIDYDSRGRSNRIESDRDEAVLLTKTLIAFFETLSDDECQRPIEAAYTVGYGDTSPKTVRTNLDREIAYCVSHAVHHFAIMRLICAQMEIEVPEEFGIAPSTLKHRAAQVAQ